MTKIDLDDLERKARGVVDTRTDFELGQWRAEHAFQPRRWQDEQLHAARVHIAANSPAVTLALIAHIRDLRAMLSSLSLSAEAAGVTFEAGLARALLDTGVVLP